LHLALISIVVSLAAGAGIALLIEYLRPAIDETKALAALSGREVLGVVSMIVTPQGLRARRAGLIRFGMACALLVTLQVTWVAWIALNPRVF
jgi:hypothetical protein